jgi:hypothetical protein
LASPELVPQPNPRPQPNFRYVTVKSWGGRGWIFAVLCIAGGRAVWGPFQISGQPPAHANSSNTGGRVYPLCQIPAPALDHHFQHVDLKACTSRKISISVPWPDLVCTVIRRCLHFATFPCCDFTLDTKWCRVVPPRSWGFSASCFVCIILASF